ncbi:MAG: flagellar biosynthesis regulator FlaF [Sulfitobacter sp.]
MNSYAMAQRAYAPSAAPTRSTRSIEYDVIARITFRLKSAINKGSFPMLLEALHENRKLWRTLAIDVADDANGLPDDLRARLFYLAEFTDHHTRRVIRKEADAVPLLEVNTAILRGLKQIGFPS